MNGLANAKLCKLHNYNQWHASLGKLAMKGLVVRGCSWVQRCAFVQHVLLHLKPLDQQRRSTP